MFTDLLRAAAGYLWSVDFAGLVFGVLGSFLLAENGRRAGWGFVAFLASNVGWILFAWHNDITNLLLQHLVFAASSLYGVWTRLLRQPRRAPDFFDTEHMETEIWRRFNGGNAAELAFTWGVHPCEVYDIVDTYKAGKR